MSLKEAPGAPPPSSSVSSGQAVIITDDDRAAVVAAGFLRRRIALALRIVPTLLVIAGVGWCSVDLMVSFGGSRCRAQQSEAKGNLKSLYVGIQSARAEDPALPLTFASLGFQPRGAKIRYRYALTDVGIGETPGFIGWAFRSDDVVDDVWTVGPEGTPTNVATRCDR